MGWPLAGVEPSSPGHGTRGRRSPVTARLHATWGTAISLFGVQAGINMVRDLTFPLWASWVPTDEATVLFGLVRVDEAGGGAVPVGLGLV